MIKASLSYGNYRQRRRLAVGHAKGEREQTTRYCIKTEAFQLANKPALFTVRSYIYLSKNFKETQEIQSPIPLPLTLRV
ncbi:MULTISPECIES: hypothetical protein [Moorena]|uniref:hypothetical protein n=1 Tax=Moorena TaxID=1155738 RepID=UPI0003087D61|nr:MULTISPECIES: hypothetical protein [Moorena]NEQ12955.1 hypothetical protein [Moorena sp. SIO3E2]NEP32906.1 hypothetical protein [Moorena sp. SIO3B2]NEP70073.1 hypothetical protein [Moorena sp. SIO3A5]NES41764.1 hypothetical protein [Moorena sp. SIO2C4]NET68615.1 hypothetical protein [Moorena sp. SIO1G6]